MKYAPNLLEDPAASYGALDDSHLMSFIDAIRKGFSFNSFLRFSQTIPFTMQDWSSFLHLSERTLQRYEKEKKKFDPMQSERILEIAILFKKGASVFGSNEKFNLWLETESLALGRIKPKTLLDNSFGIRLIKDELTRIEHGVLA
jgi:putative toxin-antitoxin system antitoxin component (TIGR02293 family)